MSERSVHEMGRTIVRTVCERACLLALALLLGAVPLAGCSAAASTNQRDPGTLVNLTRTDGATMNPLYTETVQDGNIYVPLVYQSLSYIGADYRTHPRLATSWSHTADGRHWTVDLRRGVRWSDGQPFTSQDVVFSYKIMLDPKTAFVDFGSVKYITKVIAEGRYRVRFDLAYPSSVFVLYALGESILPEHVVGHIPADRQRFSSLGEHPVGTGPYMLARWQHDSETVFVRNPYSWLPVKIARIDFRTIFNDQSELEALVNGSADLIDDMSFSQYTQLRRIAPQIKTMTFSSLYLDVVEVNTSRPGLSDIAVRQAMMYGYDRKAIVDGFFGGHVEYPQSLTPAALSYWHDPNLQQYPYDPAKARAILDAAGWKLGPGGVRTNGKTRLAFELLLNQGSAVITDEMLTFVSDMSDIGIEVNLRQLDFPSLVSRTYSGAYDLVADGRGGAVDPDETSILDSSQIPPNGFNTTRYRDAIVDRDLRLGLTTLSDARRRAYYDQMQQELAKTLPILYQYGRFASMGYSARLELDPKTTLQSPLLYYNVQDWQLRS